MTDNPKPVLVFVPGLGSNGAVYGLLLDRLRKDYDVRSADLPERFPKELTWPFFFGVIDQAAAGAERFELLGHSMGGGIALKYAAAHPGRVNRTVVVSPVLFPFRAHRRPWRERFRHLRTAIRRGHPVHLLRMAQILRSRATGGRAGKQFRFSRSIDLHVDLPKVRNATVLWPEEEELIPRSQLEELRREYPQILTRTVPGAHHDIAIGPEPLVPVIEEALRG